MTSVAKHESKLLNEIKHLIGLELLNYACIVINNQKHSWRSDGLEVDFEIRTTSRASDICVE